MDRAEAFMLQAMELQEPMNAAMRRGDSVIQEWYRGKVIFVTGGSGYLGKLLIEKLLRACDIKRIYLLMKAKKGRNIQERLDDIVKEELFDPLRKTKPHFSEKLAVIEGDVTELYLGIKPSDWKTLTEEVNIIFHEAATTRFNENLKKATLINVRGTREIIKLGKACKQLRSFVHVSTAFCHSTKERSGTNIMEKFYPSPILPSAIIELAEKFTEDRLDEMTPTLIEGWPNTYAFTKAVAEELIRVEGSELPINIVRPPVVTPTYFEPVPGWTDKNIFGVIGIMLGFILGVLHVAYMKRVNLSGAPADLVTNATIVASWDADARREKEDAEIAIYSVSNSKCNYSLGDIIDFARGPVSLQYASPRVIWYTCCALVSNRFLFWILSWLFHFIPAYIATTFIYLLRIKLPEDVPPIIKIYRKFYDISILYSHFVLNEWFLTDDNTVKLIERLSKSDQDIFNFDVRTVDYDRCALLSGLGIRKYNIKDGLKDTEYAGKKVKVLQILHYIACAIYIYILYTIVRFTFGWLFMMF